MTVKTKYGANGKAKKRVTIDPPESKRKSKATVNRVADLVQPVTITAPNFQTAEFEIRGTAPYVQLAFGEKARNTMREKQAAGSTATKGRKREAKDFDELFQQAQHRSRDGWCGIPASSIRKAMVAACSIVGFHMTKAKKAVFVECDGYSTTGEPLIRLSGGKPRHVEHPVRNATGVADIRVRAMFDEWSAKVRIRFDADLFTITDVSNLLMRAGVQVGIGEGRPDSKSSCGMGWGTFEVVQG